jgi:diguanylate cyclase (GGDEF)-like protein/PAS domain S-box-containing protein
VNRTVREFLKLYGPLALAIVLAAAWFLVSRNQTHVELVRVRQEIALARESLLVSQEMSSRASDSRFLAGMAARAMAQSATPTAWADLEQTFLDFARNRPQYFQLRYLDAAGMERIRVERTYAGPELLQPQDLQNKSHRYYFSKAASAGRNDVYISDFDLNVEHGRVEMPPRPTLRFASPVLGPEGTRLGAVVLNYEGQHLLNQIRSAVSTGESTTLLCDGDGFWMLGPSSDEEWGRDLGQPEMTVTRRFPAAWKIISTSETGQIMTPEGMFTFETMDVVPGAIMSAIPPSAETAARRWKVLTWVPQSALDTPLATPFTALAALFLALLLPGCWFLARYRVNQAEVEARLRESEERTLAISQSAQDAIIMIDDQDRISYWNPAAERLLGYSAEEAMGQRLHRLLPAEPLQARAEAGLTGFARSGRGSVIGHTLELEARRKNGSMVMVELSVSAFTLKGRWYAVGSLRDMTRRKADEIALKRSEETSRTLLNAPEDVAMLIEPNGRVIAINQIGARLYDTTPEEMIGRLIFDFVPHDMVENRRALLRRVMDTGEPARLETIRNDRRLQINVYPVPGVDGGVERVAIYARDVTEQRTAEIALKRSEQRFRDVSEAVGEFIWETNENDEFTFVTEDVTFVLGYTAEELTGRTPALFIPEEHVNDFTAWRSEIYRDRAPFSKIELRCVTKEGQRIWLQSSGVPYFDDEDTFQGFRGADMNISDRKETENAIKASEQKLRALAESAYDAIVMINASGLISFWNQAAERLFGYGEEEAVGRDLHELITPPDLREEARRGMLNFEGTGSGPAIGAIQETVALRKDGTRMPVERSISSFRIGANWYAVGTIRDITERKATEARLRELATTDGLTGLFNRRRFMELAEREFARSKRYQGPLAMLMMDIDHFKRVNDTHGHDVGDEVLRELASTSLKALREADILGRLGGEEFAVLLPETETSAAMDVAERLRRAVEESPMETNGGKLAITVSIGAACMEAATGSVEELLKRADVALYEAKQSGRNKVVAG